MSYRNEEPGRPRRGRPRDEGLEQRQGPVNLNDQRLARNLGRPLAVLATLLGALALGDTEIESSALIVLWPSFPALSR